MTTTCMPPFDREPVRPDSLDDFFAACDERHELIDWEKERFRHPRVRRCPLCEDAVYGNDDFDDECEIHGDPYESPYEDAIMFERLFGRLPPNTSSVKRRRIREWQSNFPMPSPTRETLDAQEEARKERK
ncbi:MAG TPA: hypothetical protein VN397_04545 [Candidatus Methylomirabilis sp.]|nr:hypothetical protein [Candidatus Methylomirabilis sp.]